MELKKYIDHTILATDATEQQLDKLIAEAKEYDFMSVCVSPIWVSKCAQALKDTDVKVCTVIGFPQGTLTTATKVFETKDAIANGATEVDMVIPVGLLKQGNLDAVRADIAGVVEAAKGKALTKVIIETCLLTDEEIVTVCQIAKEVGADFVKTSTGFSTAGATEHAVALMRKTVGPDMGVKASGGVRTLDDAKAMIAAGANRIGTSNGVAIVKG
ncbi:deoxyribose-phosphate aldolase [Anaerobiospirillum succiniciproducens]|uniref:deoxyribose-phosphate aldolase n=1 Tax=Anaerobiospirillum succiniciproducens TaxID=13335 RepID=UPI003F8A678D